MPHYTRSDFDFDLPQELIAQYPTPTRTESRLLQITPGRMPLFHDKTFSDLLALVNSNDLLVFNDTRVIKARFFGRKTSGGRVELLIERIVGDHEALAQLRASHAPAIDTTITPESGGNVQLVVLGRENRFFRLRFDGVDNIVSWLDKIGQMPLPPYIKRSAKDFDESRYQTVYARVPGAVAAPTAGLHFDRPFLDRLRDQGVGLAYVTLHVGAGTFQPVQVEDLREHVMHRESFDIPQATIDAVAETRRRGGRIVAVGTTSLRALEASSDESGRLRSGWAETALFITPGYRFKTADCLITNFHLPGSTLLMLVSAFSGYETIRSAYAHAVKARYRFFSYGDAMLLERS